MIANKNVIISDDIITEKFVCDLQKCKGACCVEGDAGAPLEIEELAIIESVFDRVKKYMNEKGITAVEKEGMYVVDSEGDYTTPCVDGNKECAYVIFENGITQCAFEKAYNDGTIDFKKPISCHLYPIRITKYKDYDALNYDRWTICASACLLGVELKIPVYVFLKDALIRKYGSEWYQALEEQIVNKMD